MAIRFVITHLNGPKANQIEEFPYYTINEISIGRDPKATLAFDRQRDDMVSRRHAVIRVERGERATFKITDLGSSNGTLVNGMRISQDVELMPGDTVELGAGGPKFTFDLQPRPPAQSDRTRVAPLAAGAATATAARPASTAVAAAPTAKIEDSAAAKQTVGLETVQQMLTAQRQAHSRLWAFSIIGILAFILVAGGALYYFNRMTVASVFANMNSAVMTPLDVVQKYGNATVYIALQWQLYDKETGKRVFHKKVLWKTRNTVLPAYVKLPNGDIVRWLTTEDESHSNEAIGEEGSGSGFVIDGQGFLLTNKHVAAGWMVEYGFRPYEGNGGVLFQLDSAFKVVSVTDFDPTSTAQLYHWIPDKGGIVFDSRQPFPLSASEHLFEGRNEQLDIRFPGQRVSYASRLIRASTDADVAEIRIDSVQGLPAVELEQKDGVQVGEKVTVLGYPAISEQKIATIVTREVGRQDERQELIPEPTVTDGLIAKIGTGAQQTGDVTTSGSMGDVYQLTVVATGAGNSGGPVFNAAGKVIGLFTYAKVRGAERVTFAVPIRFGRELVAPQKLN